MVPIKDNFVHFGHWHIYGVSESVNITSLFQILATDVLCPTPKQKEIHLYIYKFNKINHMKVFNTKDELNSNISRSELWEDPESVLRSGK